MQKITEIIALLEKNLQGVNAKRSRADPLDVLIATMLSQNTTDKTSYRAFMNLKSDIGSWDSVLKAPLSKIRKAIRICGLTNQKAKNIKRLLSRLKNERGELSLNYLKPLGNDEIYEDLIKYNGIGTKTISCVLAFGLGRDVFPVDTHVHRLSNRLGLVKTKSPDKTFEQVQKEIPKGKKFLLNTLFIRYGRKICRSRNPLCGKCVLYDLCEFEYKDKYYEGTLDSSKGRQIGQPKENNFIILEHIDP